MHPWRSSWLPKGTGGWIVKADRLRGTQSFSRVFEEGCTQAGRTLVLHYLPREAGTPRVGFAAGKRLGGAVVRNRLRRVLREAFRTLPGTMRSADIVFVARHRTQQSSFARIQEEMHEHLRRAGLCADEHKRDCQFNREECPSSP